MQADRNHTALSNDFNKELEEKKVWQILEQVYDPEIPVLTVIDLGIVRNVSVQPAPFDNGKLVTVTITPTYSGCPAMDAISMNIRFALMQNGYKNVHIAQQISPAWTTDWMSDSGKQKLQQYGIAPPVGKSFDQKYLEQITVECPKCHSTNTKLISEFGSTSCKALYQCKDCLEPFDYFKCH